MTTTRERIPVFIFEDDEEIVSVVASRIAALIRERAAEGKPAVLGLATGSSPVGVYRELIRLHREQGLSFENVITFNLDEYFPMDPDSIHSYHRYMREHLLDHVDIPDANIHILRGDLPPQESAEHCAAFERAIAEVGGIDLQLLGIGRSGHIGFNEPGSGRESRTRLTFLETITRADAAADFFGEPNVPLEALTMGVATILEAREIALIVTGEHKAGIIRRAVEGEVDSDVAATFLQMHPNAAVYVDTAAAADLTRVATPWLVGEVEWNLHREVEAVTWLAKRVERSVLRLGTGDYRDHHLSALLARHGTAEPLNGLVFNTLIAKIRGRAKLPKGRRIVVFSPHPDDDVISMGGTLAKLHHNGNHITVAYQTSGNIAVFDHEVRRYLELLTRIADGFPQVAGGAHEFEHRIEETLGSKNPGDVDEPDVLTLKRLIRETEAISALETFGMSAEQARFLNLPFYQTGAVKKKPIADADVAIVSEVIDEAEPDLVFAAGDLSDPHGTHRLCLEAVRRALEIYRGPAPEVWLYRGAWQEWPVTEASVLVPMSQADLRLKILAIYRHQSQKDEALFPGPDPREFWERVEDRNRATAAELERLGLPAYYAMEAFVVEQDGERLENPVVPTSSLADRDG
ncbi:MAG: glucosamine-6-phosphate deaminase [Gammaproteobacteria bacterium]|nr:glucosamine-6-phosphate deaminase [Gammaproteobacteria bacterium]